MRGYGEKFAQAFVVAVCIVLAGLAPLFESATTELFLASVALSAACSSWIFLTSEIGRR